MATPTPQQPNHPSSAAKRPTTAAQNISTPSYLAHSSPAPRSVPSPAATRKDQAGKTPTNLPTTGSSQSSRTLGGTPMVASLSQQGHNTASPAMLGFGTPAGLGVDLGTPGALVGTPALGGPLVPTMSELGLTQSGGQKRNEDEERRSRLRRILKAIGRPKGRVSEEGIARVARRVGFANDIDAEKLTAEEKAKKVGNRTVSIAGNTLVVDVDLKQHRPRSVAVMFSPGLAEQAAEKVGEVLLGHLRGGGIGATLDAFARDLEWMARVDRLSSQSVDCFAALSGLGSSLGRLYEQEVRISKESGLAEGKAVLEAICKRSGRPASHENGRLGLAIQYWCDDRSISPAEADANAMDVDTAEDTVTPDATEQRTYTLRIEVERSSPELYPPIRTTDDWLPKTFDRTEPPHHIPWQDPEPTFLLPDPDGMAVDEPQKLPDLRFVAKFDPPLVMPWQTATNIMTAVGAPAPQAFPAPQSYHALLLRLEAAQVVAASSTIGAEQDVLAMRDGKEEGVRHLYRLGVSKPDFGFKLEELPFSHPRQLVELLPTLRQWACAGALLRRTFSTGSLVEQNTTTDQKRDSKALESLLEDSLPASGGKLPIDITLTTAPVPTLGLTFPATAQREKDIATTVAILPNGDLNVASPSPSQGDAGTDDNGASRRLGRALDVCNDLGVWIEWLRASAT